MIIAIFSVTRPNPESDILIQAYVNGRKICFFMDRINCEEEMAFRVVEVYFKTLKEEYEKEKAQDVQIMKKYRHFKTKDIYKVFAISKHTETGEDLVLYTKDYKEFWARPKSIFESYTCDENGNKVPRFQRVD